MRRFLILLLLAAAVRALARECPECVLPIEITQTAGCRVGTTECRSTLTAQTSETLFLAADTDSNFIWPRPADAVLPSLFNTSAETTFTWTCASEPPTWALSSDTFVASASARAETACCNADECLHVVRGDDTRLLVRDSIVFTPEGVLDQGCVLVDTTKQLILCVGTLEQCAEQASGATTIFAPGTVLLPGLINPHDHLAFNWNPPANITALYGNRQEWVSGYSGLPVLQPNSLVTKEVRFWVELRHLIAGTTSILDALALPGLVRNLETNFDGTASGLPQEIVYFSIPYLGRPPQLTPESPCADFRFFSKNATFPSATSVLVTHIGEGTDAFTRREIECAFETGLATNRSVWVHAMLPDQSLITQLAASGTNVVWSPRTEVSLYNGSTPVSQLLAANVSVSLSTDWTVSGSVDLLRELRCAQHVNHVLFGSELSESDLVAMCTAVPAKQLHIDSYVGTLRAGLWADLALYAAPPGITAQNAASFLVNSATPRDVLMTMVNGAALYGERSLMRALYDQEFLQTISVCSTEKALLWQNTTWGLDYANLGELERVLRAQTEGCPVCVETPGLSASCRSCLEAPEVVVLAAPQALEICQQVSFCSNADVSLVQASPACTPCLDANTELAGAGAPLYPFTFDCDAPPPGEPSCNFRP